MYVYQQKHNGQPCIRMCLQTELLGELYKAKNLVLAILYSLIISGFKQFNKKSIYDEV